MKPVADSAPAPAPTPAPAHPALAFVVGLIAQAWSNPAIQSFVMSLFTGLVATPKTADPSAVNCARGPVCGNGAPAPSIPSLLSAVDSSVQAYVAAAAAVATDQTAVAAAQASLSADTVTAASIQAAAVVAISALQAGMAA